MTDFISVKPKTKLSKEERKAIHDKKEKERLDARNKAKMDFMFGFDEEKTCAGDFSKDFGEYHRFDHMTLELNPCSVRDEIFKQFPEEFLKTYYPIIFDNTYWIGVDVDDVKIPYTITTEDGTEISPYTNNDMYMEFYKTETRRQIADGVRSNSTLKIFHKDHPETVRSIKINIWRHPMEDAYDYFFDLEIRPNRIYLNDYDGFKVFDFELNLLFFKPVPEYGDNFDFKIDKENWNMVRIWSYKKGVEIDDSLPRNDDVSEPVIDTIIRYASIIEEINV